MNLSAVFRLVAHPACREVVMLVYPGAYTRSLMALCVRKIQNNFRPPTL